MTATNPLGSTTSSASNSLFRKLQALVKRRHVKRAYVKIAFTPVGGLTRAVTKTVTL